MLHRGFHCNPPACDQKNVFAHFKISLRHLFAPFFKVCYLLIKILQFANATPIILNYRTSKLLVEYFSDRKNVCNHCYTYHLPATIFYKRLDVYRFIAVFFVMLSHWLGFLQEYVNLGGTGVIMFFVLSGFLITNSILSALENKTAPSKVFRVFYIRRFLRIFPLYYLVIFVFYFFFKDAVLIKDLKYYVFYAVNFLVLKIQHWPDHFSHLWSLSAEEQFYLVWPVLIIPFFSKKNTGIKIICTLVLLVVYLLLSYNTHFFLLDPLYSSLPIVAGGLLSWYWNYHKDYLLSLRLPRAFPFVMACYICLRFFMDSYYFYGCFLIVTITASLLLIIYLIDDEKEKPVMFDGFFKNKTLGYLGKISYGIYVYHNLMYHLFAMVGFDRRMLSDWSVKGYLVYFLVYPVFYLIATILISILSWELFERPINNLKRYFPY
jgi:peptidoglycan/LPS O-acetylase OafA/YrhL